MKVSKFKGVCVSGFKKLHVIFEIFFLKRVSWRSTSCTSWPRMYLQRSSQEYVWHRFNSKIGQIFSFIDFIMMSFQVVSCCRIPGLNLARALKVFLLSTSAYKNPLNLKDCSLLWLINLDLANLLSMQH